MLVFVALFGFVNGAVMDEWDEGRLCVVVGFEMGFVIRSVEKRERGRERVKEWTYAVDDHDRGVGEGRFEIGIAGIKTRRLADA